MMNERFYKLMKAAEKNWLDHISDAFRFFEELAEVYTEYTDENNLYDDMVYSSPEEMLEGMDTWTAFTLGCNSDFNWTDDIFYFDGYGNIKSCCNWFQYFEKNVDYDMFSEWYTENYPEEATELLETYKF